MNSPAPPLGGAVTGWFYCCYCCEYMQWLARPLNTDSCCCCCSSNPSLVPTVHWLTRSCWCGPTSLVCQGHLWPCVAHMADADSSQLGPAPRGIESPWAFWCCHTEQSIQFIVAEGHKQILVLNLSVYVDTLPSSVFHSITLYKYSSYSYYRSVLSNIWWYDVHWSFIAPKLISCASVLWPKATII